MCCLAIRASRCTTTTLTALVTLVGVFEENRTHHNYSNKLNSDLTKCVLLGAENSLTTEINFQIGD